MTIRLKALRATSLEKAYPQEQKSELSSLLTNQTALGNVPPPRTPTMGRTPRKIDFPINKKVKAMPIE